MLDVDQKSKFIKQLETYQDRLLDISWRNRSVLLRKTMKKWNIDLATLARSLAVRRHRRAPFFAKPLQLV